MDVIYPSVRVRSQLFSCKVVDILYPLCLQFLEERCEQAEGVNIRSKSLFDAYKIWCKSNGYFACSAKRFNADMETHPEWHGGKVVYQGYPVYKNLRLKGAS